MGKHEQFTLMHNRLYNKIFSYVHFRINDRDEVADIVQDVFLKAWRTWAEVPEDSIARQYLYVITRSKIIDHLRLARNRHAGFLTGRRTNDFDEFAEVSNPFDTLESDTPLPEDMFIQSENSEKVQDYLKHLEPIERELITLRFIEELEYKELAEIYNTSQDNVRKKVSRALSKLRKKVENEN